tara:strand:- start:8436 stop:8939 length:504 start_codon:yes stop_codon:yes gene_type:complete
MTITCVVLNQSSNYFEQEITIGAFDGDQFVGTTTTNTFFPPINANLGFLVVYSNQLTDSYTLKVVIDDQVVNSGELRFESNGVLGTLESNIIIDLPNGWSMFGFTKSESINLIDATFCITDNIIVVKDYLGAACLPEFNFNGIGSLIPGLGYQLKLSNQINQFNFCH